MVSKNTICLWYDGTALEAAQFYAKTFPDSAVGAIHRAPGDYPAGKEGDDRQGGGFDQTSCRRYRPTFQTGLGFLTPATIC